VTIRKLARVDVFKKFMDADIRESKITELKKLWQRELPGLPLPDDAQFARWLRPTLGDPRPLAFAIGAAAQRMRFQKWRDPLHHVSWISSVALSFYNGNQRKAA
jgi:hypothetical protein